MIRALGLALPVCLLALLGAQPLSAAQPTGKISGVVIDPSGIPQMGATVLIASEKFTTLTPVDLLTNDRGRFATSTLPSGLYSVKVTLAGFLPAIEQHVQVTEEHTTLLEIVLGSLFSSLDKLRRAPDEQLPSDEWGWVLRGSAATRVVLRWQQGEVEVVDGRGGEGGIEIETKHAQLEFTSGSDHPGSVSNLADSPATAFAYDFGIGPKAKLLMAGQFSYDGIAPAGGVDLEWLPSGEVGKGPVTSLVVRQSRIGPGGPTFRGARLAHDDQLALGDRVTIRYGGELMMAGLDGNTMALRPRAEVALKFSPTWQAAFSVAARPWDSSGATSQLQSALNNLDAFPTLLIRNGRPVLENDLHEEVAVEHALSEKSDITAAVFHDQSSHTAVFGMGNVSGTDYLQDSFTNVFAYDGGNSSSIGMRVAYRRKIATNLDTTLVYAYAGALAPNAEAADLALREELATRYRQTLAARASTKVPRLGTKLTTSYKWINGPAVSHVDAFGESTYHLDPYLSVEVRQPLPSFLPGHMEALADFGNLLAQGYVPIATNDGRVVLVPSYRYFKGGLSFQF
jgi:hypothetical protein